MNKDTKQDIQNPEGEEGDRGIGKALLIGAGAAIAAVGAYAMYKHVEKKKKKKKIKTKKGKSKKIKCDVFCDDKGRELPGQEFDEDGRCINEEYILSEAAKRGQISYANPEDNNNNPLQYNINQQYNQNNTNHQNIDNQQNVFHNQSQNNKPQYLPDSAKKVQIGYNNTTNRNIPNYAQY